MSALLDRILAPFAPAPDRTGAGDTMAPSIPDRPPASDEHDRVVDQALSSCEKREFGRALAIINGASEEFPSDPRLSFAKGLVLTRWGRHREALVHYLRASDYGMADASLHARLGWACLSANRLEDAQNWMRKAVAERPGDRDSTFGLGVVLAASQRHADAIACFDNVLALDPQNVAALLEMSRARLAQHEPALAESTVRRVIALKPTHADAWDLLGVALAHQDRHTEALEAFANAESVALNTNDTRIETFANVAISLCDLGRTREALEILDRELPNRPHLNGHLAYGPALLSEGRFAEGWTQFEFRWYSEPLASLRRDFGKPVWDGQDLNGKTVLLRLEQGYGDVFQMIRFVPMLKARGATVLMLPAPDLAPLSNRFPGVDTVVEANQPLPHFDYYIHLMSLPRVLATTELDIPADTPYLNVDPDYVRRWMLRIPSDGKLNVGLVWSGSPKQRINRRRSIPLRQLLPIMRVHGVRFFALQKGPAAVEADEAFDDVDLIKLDPELLDFGDTAAAISQLDLVISICTSVTHLAGALGRPVWLLLSEPADYRWLNGRDDTPWYPTMRLFRQSRPGVWDDVIERARAELEKHVAGRVIDPAPPRVSGSGSAQPPAAKSVDSHRPLSVPKGMAVATETRVGLLQYVPDSGIMGRSVHFYGEYLQPQIDYLLRLVRPGATVLEVGAGFGVHSVLLGRALSADGHLMLYESNAVTRRMLAQNLAANRVNNATLMQRELGYRATVDTKQLPFAEDAQPTSSAAHVLELDTLDDLQMERLDWLKINPDVDVLGILSSASDTLWRLRPCLSLSSWDASWVPAQFDLVKQFGYRGWRREIACFNAQNFNQRREDIFEGLKVYELLAIPEEIDIALSLPSESEL